MAYGKLNGHVTDDVKWPWKVKLVTPMRLRVNVVDYLVYAEPGSQIAMV